MQLMPNRPLARLLRDAIPVGCHGKPSDQRLCIAPAITNCPDASFPWGIGIQGNIGLTAVSAPASAPPPPVRIEDQVESALGVPDRANDSASPSRMSCSETVICGGTSGANRPASSDTSVDRINAPPPMTSTRPGCI